MEEKVTAAGNFRKGVFLPVRAAHKNQLKESRWSLSRRPAEIDFISLPREEEGGH